MGPILNKRRCVHSWCLHANTWISYTRSIGHVPLAATSISSEQGIADSLSGFQLLGWIPSEFDDIISSFYLERDAQALVAFAEIRTREVYKLKDRLLLELRMLDEILPRGNRVEAIKTKMDVAFQFLGANIKGGNSRIIHIYLRFWISISSAKRTYIFHSLTEF